MELFGQKFISTPGLAGGTGTFTSTTGNLPGANPSTLPALPSRPGSADIAAQLRLVLQGSIEKPALSWTTVSGAVYQVQTSTNLISWTDFGPERAGSGASDSLRFDPDGRATFYRVKRVR